VAEVFRVLAEIGAASTPQILVLNKCDRIAPDGDAQDAPLVGARLLAGAGQSTATPAVLVSGRTGEGLPLLLAQIDAVLPFDAVETVRFRIPLRDGASIALLHECGKVLSEDYHGNLCEIDVEAPESLRRRLKRYLTSKSTEPVENSVHK
jgi:GTP-binding protein HflX